MPRRDPVEEFVYRAVVDGEITIDDEGRVWRIASRRWNRWLGKTVLLAHKPRRVDRDTGQYLEVRVMFQGKRYHTAAHRLVWRHFNGLIPDGMTVNHKDGKKKRNRPDNLELATDAQQTRHAMDVLGWNPTKNLGSYARRGHILCR